MGRQTRFHMLTEDCRQFLEYVQQRDPVIVVDRSSKSGILEEAHRPWERPETYCLWNQSIIPMLERKFIRIESDPRASYYGIDSSLPVIEFWYASPVPEPWNGRAALTQGRVWSEFQNPTKEFVSWYNAIIRWLRKNFIRDAVLGDWVGPAAYRWYKDGGLLLPHFRPPITASWLSWVEAQDQHRAIFLK
jgi:hypothetical protein